MKTSVMKDSKSSLIFNMLKGIFISLLISLTCILIFALVIKFVGVPQNLIQPINQIIKFVSILFGVKSMYRHSTSKNIFTALLLGGIYTLLALLIFSILNKNFTFEMTMLTDMLFGAVAGFISGVIVKVISK